MKVGVVGIGLLCWWKRKQALRQVFVLVSSGEIFQGSVRAGEGQEQGGRRWHEVEGGRPGLEGAGMVAEMPTSSYSRYINT